MSRISATNGLTEDYRLVLPQSRIPTHWYNILADLPVPMPATASCTLTSPIGPADLAPLFPMELIMQEVSDDRYIPIPDEVRDIYRLWRPTPLIRAVRLEKALDTPAHIYYKNESVSPSGSHKLNTAVPQAYYNKQEGVQSIATETGAGQWGSALGHRRRFLQDRHRRLHGEDQLPAEAVPPFRHAGLWRHRHAQPVGPHGGRPDDPGPEPEQHRQPGHRHLRGGGGGGHERRQTKYSLGSVLNHVLLHQTVIGQEALDGMAEIGEYPDVVIGCVGGGSNFAGIASRSCRRR